MKINKKNILKYWSEIESTLGKIINRVEEADNDDINGQEVQKLLVNSQLPLQRLFKEFKYDNVWKRCDRLQEEISLLKKEAKDFALDELTMRNLQRTNVFITNIIKEIENRLQNKLFFEFCHPVYSNGVFEVKVIFNVFGWMDRFSCYGADDAPFFSPFTKYDFNFNNDRFKEKRKMVENSFKERGYEYHGWGFRYSDEFAEIFEKEIRETFKDLFKKIYFGDYCVHVRGGVSYLENVVIRFAQK